ncbi:MAG: signal peptide peptidase SppA [Candidatus Margulisiibacteriota bacterium]
MKPFKRHQIQSETRKVSVIIGLIICSIFVGIYDRTETSHLAPASVIPKASVMVIPVEGMISSSGSQWEGSMVDLLLDQLDEAKESKSVKAIVLRINSPGGTVGASQEIYDAINRFKSESKKPVVVSIMDIGASGAYWIALAGDYIFAQPGSIVGSLGVITQTFDLTEVPKKYGIDVRTYKAGKHKDLLNPWRTPSRQDDRLINQMLTTVHEQFRDTLIKERNISLERAKILADGRVYAGQDALAEQLVDQLGGFYTATQYAGKLANINDPKIIYPNRGFKDWFQSIRAMAQSMRIIQPNLINTLGIQ